MFTQIFLIGKVNFSILILIGLKRSRYNTKAWKLLTINKKEHIPTLKNRGKTLNHGNPYILRIWYKIVNVAL